MTDETGKPCWHRSTHFRVCSYNLTFSLFAFRFLSSATGWHLSFVCSLHFLLHSFQPITAYTFIHHFIFIDFVGAFLIPTLPTLLFILDTFRAHLSSCFDARDPILNLSPVLFNLAVSFQSHSSKINQPQPQRVRHLDGLLWLCKAPTSTLNNCSRNPRTRIFPALT